MLQSFEFEGTEIIWLLSAEGGGGGGGWGKGAIDRHHSYDSIYGEIIISLSLVHMQE